MKWLTEIEVIDRGFSGFFQTDRYFYEWERNGQVVREPVTVQRVRALITEPASDQTIERGDIAVRGLAWSGTAPIARVEVSIADGPWLQARLLGEASRHSWRRWELLTQVRHAGRTTIRARATDGAGHIQPERPEWNRLGYGSNPVQELTVLVD